jgi:hypothetical protein
LDSGLGRGLSKKKEESGREESREREEEEERDDGEKWTYRSPCSVMPATLSSN